MTAERLCTIEGCERKYRARGWCATHWGRWKKYGTTDLPKRPQYETCAAEDCAGTPRSKHSPWCDTHYYRIRRTGTHEIARPKRPQRGMCIVEDCGALDAGLDGLCDKHHSRKVRNGGPLVLRGPNVMVGQENPNWTGDEATYECLHQRLKKARGLSSRYDCIDCGRKAQHWSYDHLDPNEMFQEGKGPFSLDIYHYDPRCVRCHKKFDLGTIRHRSAAS